MKSKVWAAVLLVLLAVCIALSCVLLLPSSGAAAVEVISGGELVRTVLLNVDQSFTVTTPEGGRNTVTVSQGAIGVTEASCPDGYCMKRGFCSGGTDIVCLPNALVLRFLGETEVDAVAGQ